MTTAKLTSLSQEAHREAGQTLADVRSHMDGREYGVSRVENIRVETLGRMLALVAPCLRGYVASEGWSRDGGVKELDTDVDGTGYRFRLAAETNRRGETVPTLELGEPRDGYVRRIMNAWFNRDGTDNASVHASGRLDAEIETLALMDSLAPRLRRFAVAVKPDASMRFRAEAEMVAADGGLLGATCREYLEALRAATVRGGLERVARDLPGLVAAQAEAGFTWGERYLAYNDTDIRTCRIPFPDAVGCMHENVDLCDHLSRWVVAVEPGGRVSVWGQVRGSNDTKALVDVGVARGIAAMGPPHVSFDPATDTLDMGSHDFDAGVLVANVAHGLGADIGTFAGLAEAMEDDGVEARGDFGCFTPYGSDLADERDAEEEEVSTPSP